MSLSAFPKRNLKITSALEIPAHTLTLMSRHNFRSNITMVRKWRNFATGLTRARFYWRGCRNMENLSRYIAVMPAAMAEVCRARSDGYAVKANSRRHHMSRHSYVCCTLMFNYFYKIQHPQTRKLFREIQRKKILIIYFLII